MQRENALNRKLDRIRMQSSRGLLSVDSPGQNHIHTEQPSLDPKELELITKFPPSVLFCFHGRLYFERCLRCKRTKTEGQQNFQRFQLRITDFT